MERSLLRILFVTAILAATAVRAQRAFDGRPYGVQYERRGWSAPPEVAFPAVDVAAEVAADDARLAGGRKGPYRFGVIHPTDLRLENSGVWTIAPNGDRVWRITLHCPEAQGINLVLSDYTIPEGGKVFLYNANGLVRGAFTAQSAPGSHALGTSPFPGERITVEYVEPASAAGQGHLIIGQVVHEYRNLFHGRAKDFGDSGDCNVNTICPDGDDWRPEIRGVARIIAGAGYCSGTLLNNCNNDSTPYFLTARHCLEGATDFSGWVFQFNWESSTCDPGTNVPIEHSITGAELLAQNAGTDMAFFRLSSTPPAAFQPFYGGWDISNTTPDSATCIHHPSGDIKKISHTYEALGQDNQDLGNGPADCWWVHTWNTGTTEPGSSGSALWSQDHLIIGQLYGGEAACGNSVNDFFGRFDLSYPVIQEWLGTCGEQLPSFDPSAVIPLANNAAVTSIYGVPQNACNIDSVHAGFTLKNNGESELTSVQVDYDVSTTGLSAGFLWTGQLHPLQTVNVALPAFAPGDGPGTVTVYTSAPNGHLDADVLDDTLSIPFVAGDPGEILTLDLQLDHHGTETTWTLANDEGTLLYTGGPYQESANGYLVTTEFCLAHDCYTFTIMDGFGDGICCSEGEGHYTISDSTGVAYVIGDGQFTEVHTDEFCASAVGIDALDVAPAILNIAPNPGNGVFRLSVDQPLEADLQLDLFDALGRRTWNGLLRAGANSMMAGSADIVPGAYLLVASTPAGRSVQRVLVQR